MNLILLIITSLIIFIIIQLFNKNYKNIFIVDLNILLICLSLVFIIIKTSTQSGILPLTVFSIILSTIIILDITSFIKLKENKIIIKNSIFKKKIYIDINSIKEVYINNELYGEGSIYFIYFLLSNNQTIKVPLIYSSIYNLILNIFKRNNKIKLNFKKIKFRILFADITILIISFLIYILGIYVYFKNYF